MSYLFGPSPRGDGTLFRLWAPSQPEIRLLMPEHLAMPMSRTADGFWERHVPGAAARARYKFAIGERSFADPAARRQEGGLEGWSVVCSERPPQHPGPVRPWHEAVICEVHVGTASPEGTFGGLMQRLEHFERAGYTALQLMPINFFPGARGWGYDSVLLFAPHEAYGTPDELSALVARAHQLGLGIILDVVYNHFAECGDVMRICAPEWFDEEARKTPWGAAIALRNPMVRQFYYENARWWLEACGVDGLRFDAIHEIGTEGGDRFLSELARAARAVRPAAALVVENVKNQMHWPTRKDAGVPVDYTAQWNDDFHHVLQFLATGERVYGYEDESRDPIADLEKALADGFVHDGDAPPGSDGRRRHEPASELPMEAFVDFLQNHDQVGNRPDNRRIVDRVDAERLDFAHFTLLLSPQIPMFFMGEEAHLRTPFQFFFDLPEPFRSAQREARYWQMEHVFHTKVAPGGLADPQDVATFSGSRLDWEAFGRPEHERALARFKELAAIRRAILWPLTASAYVTSASARQDDALIVTWQYCGGDLQHGAQPERPAGRPFGVAA
jgi:malto-oligosyltrehalose trehalohydrolase